MMAAVQTRPEPEPGDGDLVLRARAGDEDAFAALVHRYQPAIYRFLARRLGVDEARDATQGAFLRAFLSLDKLGRPESFRPWLYRIAANLAASTHRARRELASPDLDERSGEGPLPGAAFLERERRLRLRALIAALPERQRLVVELRVHEELPFAEIAEVAGITESTAKVTFHHAVRRLRQRLAEEDKP
jgi:RNA polymerase sigma-70 factor (ECF subfamily)